MKSKLWAGCILTSVSLLFGCGDDSGATGEDAGTQDSGATTGESTDTGQTTSGTEDAGSQTNTGKNDAGTNDTGDTSSETGGAEGTDSGTPPPDSGTGQTEQEAGSGGLPELVIDVVDEESSEAGDTAEFTLQLSAAPPTTVTLSISSDNPKEGRPDLETLTFSSANWDQPQTVTVTGQDDSVADGDQAYSIQLELVDVGMGVDVSQAPMMTVDLVNLDDDEAGVMLTAANSETSEDGDTVSLSVELTSEPTSEVTLTLASSNTDEGTVPGDALIFTPETWDVPQSVTVTGVDDAIADGDQTYQITASASSDDANYDDPSAGDITLTNLDNDVAGFVINVTQASSSEAGGEAVFSVALDTEPTADVTVMVTSEDETEGIPAVTQLVFTPVNWQAPQTVVVDGQDDQEVDGNQEYVIDLDASGSADPAYAASDLAMVTLTNIDNDAPGFTVSAISGNTSEAGTQATFSVVLNFPPTANVTVRFASDTPTEGVTTATSLVFTDVNWAAPQIVTVTGVDDDQADGDQNYQIVFSATSSADQNYASLIPSSVSVTNLDNDSPGVVAVAADTTTSETGETATVNVSLASAPTDDVVISLASSDESEGSLAQTSLTFTPLNWNAPQTVTVTGVDDSLIDGDQPYALSFTSVSSSDASYDGLTVADVALSNTDNDSPGVVMTRQGTSTSESGNNVDFVFTLRSQPNADVSFSLASNDTTEGAILVDHLTFTSTNWNVPQTVRVYGRNDDLADGNQIYYLQIGTTVSTDPDQNGIAIASPAITNVDDDSAGITVSAVSGHTTEEGGTATFTVVLNSEPYNDVTVNFDTNDSGEGSPDVTSLTFTASDWDTPQTVTLTGANDDVADGNQPYAIQFSATTSDDPAYAAITPNNIDVVNDDDDVAGFDISTISGDVSEDGTTATFTIALTSEPDGDVVINVATSDDTEGTVSDSQITFDANTWDQAQTITVTGVDDSETDGDVDFTIELTVDVSTTDTTGYAGLDPNDVAVTCLDNDFGTMSGTVRNALNNATISGATVSVQGTAFSTTTNSSGNYSLSGITPGTYTVDITATGYNDESISDVAITSGNTTSNGTTYMNPTLNEGEIRAVISWTPSRDLDFHAFTPGGEHIYYQNRNGTNISLDHDSGTGGPETITITVQAAGTYSFHVFNYAENLAICSTGVQARVFDSTGLIATLDPSGLSCASGDYTWNAFTLNGGVVTATNTVGSASP